MGAVRAVRCRGSPPAEAATPIPAGRRSWSSAPLPVRGEFLGDELTEPLAERPEIGALAGELDDGLEVADRRPGVVPDTPEHHAVHGRTLLEQQGHRVGQLDLAAGPRTRTP